MKTETRTHQQNKALFKFHELVANEMNNIGITLDKLVLEIEPRPTKESIHILFKWILEKMHNKTSSTKMTREELNSVLEVELQALATLGVVIDFPSADRQHLLSFYN